MHIYFDVPNTYYLPQYAPVIAELKSRGINCHATLRNGDDIELKQHAAKTLDLPFTIVNGTEEALALYRKTRPDWVVYGHSSEDVDHLPEGTRSALLYHGSGTGVKNVSISPGLGNFNVRFVSGPGRMKIFQELYPGVDLVEVGFAKLDPLRTEEGIAKSRLDLDQLGLDKNKPTLLYAPTFYPSSIENMSRHFPKHFADFNLLVKAHDFTYSRKRYRHQLRKLTRWSHESNVYFAPPTDFSLVPYMASADMMVTDTSSAIFEFASLNKPVIICDFIRLRLGYRGPFKYRIKKRLDDTTLHYQRVADRAARYKDLRGLVDAHMEKPKLLEHYRLKYADEIMGKMDGKASVRVADYFTSNARSD
ncbi:MAG: CDP-glycerol glycerophosphotransferase family protein [Pseudomonadota bacterium]